MKNYLKLYNLETAYSLSGNNFFFSQLVFVIGFSAESL